jgi:LuxR family maltose regulon positive regulatory protein
VSPPATTSPLLSVKQTVPPVRPGVARPRLEERLATARTGLTVVVAPAGWGKTSLVSRWAATAAGDVALAWVSLDESDDEPLRFWSYLLSALARAGDTVSTAPAAALASSSGGPIAQALPLLLNELADSPVEHVVVLDDYHLISHPEVHESLEFLVTHLPPTLRVVIATRWDPPLPLARLRARGELTELRAADLRFSAAESATLVSGVAGTELDDDLTAAVWERTEGWAAGLQLAGLALRSGDRATAAAHVGGDAQHLFDYFTAEVLPTLSPAQRDLLVRAGPLELLSGSLCDTALGVEGSGEVLDELERAGLFVVALDAQREWFRCHRLLRDALLRLPEVRSSDSRPEVLGRAAGWFEAHDRIDDAVRHLHGAGLVERAAALLVERRLWFVEKGWAASYVALAERLPDAVVRTDLALVIGYAADICGLPDRVAQWFDVAERRLDADSVVPSWRSARAALLSLRGALGTPDSEPARAVELCEEGLALENAAGGDRQPDAVTALGRAYGFAGRFADGVEILADTWRRRGKGVGLQLSTERSLQVAGLLSLFLLALDRGAEADRVVAEAAALAAGAERDWGEAATAQVTTLLRLVEGRRSHLRGDPDAAAAQLGRGARLAELAGRPTYTVIGLVFLADHELATGHRTAARASLVRARELVDTEPVTPFVAGWLAEAETRIGRSAARTAVGAGALFEELTDRELSILRLLPGPATQREIGTALFLSVNTVKAYNKSLYRKLGAGGRADAVLAARRLGLI